MLGNNTIVRRTIHIVV